ncbi:CotH kinase family protein [Planctomycetota bacterium]
MTHSSRIAIFVFAISLSLPLAASEFYDSDVINTLQLIFTDDNWDADLDAIYKTDNDGDGNYDRLLCTAIINGIQYEDVGVRYKGNSSYSTRNAKNPFNIKLDHVLDQDYEGYGTLKLSNVYKDPSFVRETLSYEIARKYMAASQANYMNVYVYNHSRGEYRYVGLYTNVEAVDKKFFSDQLYSGENARFKCNATTTWSPNSSSSGSSLVYLGSDPSLYYGTYQLKSNDPTIPQCRRMPISSILITILLTILPIHVRVPLASRN